MNKSISVWRNSLPYFSVLLFLLIIGTVSLFAFGKTASFLSLNNYHTPWLDLFFINYTYVGDGIFALCLVVLFMLIRKKRKEGLAQLFAFLISGLIVQVIKTLTNAPRPKLFFEPNTYSYFIKGVTLSNNSSFPSGHTASAFALATVMILFSKNRVWHVPLLLAAILVGYSRIYLAQHFLGDVLFGGFIGMVSGILTVYITGKLKWHWISYHKLQPRESEIKSHSSSGTIQPV